MRIENRIARWGNDSSLEPPSCKIYIQWFTFLQVVRKYQGTIAKNYLGPDRPLFQNMAVSCLLFSLAFIILSCQVIWQLKYLSALTFRITSARMQVLTSGPILETSSTRLARTRGTRWARRRPGTRWGRPCKEAERASQTGARRRGWIVRSG